MAKIEKEIRITLSAKEIENILKDHFKNQDGTIIDNVYFNITLEYGDYGDHHGTHVLKEATCSGKLK